MNYEVGATDPLWYKDAILYELHVRSFADGNGDGIGDFTGLIGKLDYLQQLGVTCLWLLPFFPSPLRDDGYDIADYTGIHPSYGTMEDFRRLLEEAHRRKLQVLIELVMNHTSDQHPWFQRARHSPAGSNEREFYVWSDTETRFADARIIFTDEEKSNWAWDPEAKAFYWHRFFSHQPDLNYDNPAVLEEMLNVMRFWLNMGVDGLRLDAIPYLVERDGTNCENLPETHAIIRKIRAVIDHEYEHRLVLAEANQWPSDVRPYFGNGDECHMAFHFPLMPRMYVAIRQEDRTPIVEIMRQTPEIPNTCQWGLFLRNHDELTLEMVTLDERDYMYLAYSSDSRMRINLGIRRRLAPLLDNNRQRIELLNSLLYSFPGTPILYYGDEIGMGDNVDLGDRNGVRTPMQWNGEPNAGFSTAPAGQLASPVIADPVYGYQAVNVEEQVENPSSILQWTRNMIALRKLFPVFGRGTQRFLDPENRKVLAYLRQLDGDTVLCVANLSRFAQPVSLALDEFEGRVPVEMFGYTPFPAIDGQPYNLTLSPYAFLWFQLQKQKVQTETEWQDAEPVEEEAGSTREPAVARAATHNLEIGKQNGAADLLLRVAPLSPDELRKLAALVGPFAGENPALRITLAFPFTSAIAGGNEHLEAIQLELSQAVKAVAPTLLLAPYAQPATTLQESWPHPARTYAEVGRLAAEHHATAVMLLGQDAGSLNPEAIPAMMQAILTGGFDLAVPLYRAGRYDALVNTAVLHPLTRALYGAVVRYPLATDMAFSPRFCEHLATASAAFDVMAQDESLLWPVTEAAVNDFRMVQVHGCTRHFAPPPNIDVTELLAHILSELFADAEKHAGQWQKSYALTPLRMLNAAVIANPPQDRDHPSRPEDVAGMYDSFRLAVGQLQDVWSRTLSPGTQLRLKRLVELPAEQFEMPDALWVNIVYDFLVAYHTRSVSRMHLAGALVPLYLGWAASYVKRMAELSDEQAEAQVEALAARFETEKPYLMSRWRWPDRFAP
ncbi:MAG: maltose alpha-D-glucosyltransferase [Candidatus Korobacteraceae bacterium]